MTSLDGRIALVTGASAGLGAAVAKRLADAGAHVVLLARSVGGLEATDDAIRAKGGAATLVPLDLREGDKIDQLGAALAQRFGRLDILVAAAGVLGNLAPLGHFDPKVWAEVMEVNAVANWRLIRVLDPLLRASPAGRAVFVTCAAARTFPPYWGAYAASKAALEAMVRCYAAEVAQLGVRANLIDPGPLRTQLRAAGFPREDRDRLRPPEAAAEAFVALAAAECEANGTLVTLPPV
ncbi:MAG TPA: SDR family NAD(P)-dependent oxidoreductase [Stellaceae bacterium]|nr:SDR family NAD(P)-dependent oxidoreductase [Stellaceae bacterium]